MDQVCELVWSHPGLAWREAGESPVTVVVVLVVAAQGREAPQTDGKGEEDLGSCIHPHLHNGKEEAETYERPCESPWKDTGKLQVLAGSESRAVPATHLVAHHLGPLYRVSCRFHRMDQMSGIQRKLTEAWGRGGEDALI